MSFLTSGDTRLFPLKWIKECIATYTKKHGVAPKILVIAAEDWLDYSLNLSLAQSKQLGIKVIHGTYLKSGEIDLAMGIKPNKKKKK